MPWVSSAAAASSTTSGNRAIARASAGLGRRRPSDALDAARPAPARPRPPCAGSRRSGHGRTGRSRRGSRSTASWRARCRSRSPSVAPREAKNQRAASTPISASSSSSVMNVAGPLATSRSRRRRGRTAPRPMRIISTARLSKPIASAAFADPGDRPVVIRAPDVDQVVEAAAELLGDVADVGGEVGRLAVRADDDPVLVVAERRRAEPQRAVLLVDVAAVAQPLDRPLDPAVVVQRALGWSRRRSERRGARATPRSRPGPARDAQRPTSAAASAPGVVGRRPDVVRDSRPRARPT